MQNPQNLRKFRRNTGKIKKIGKRGQAVPEGGLKEDDKCESVICAMEGSSPCRAPAEEGARIMELIDLIYGASGQWIA